MKKRMVYCYLVSVVVTFCYLFLSRNSILTAIFDVFLPCLALVMLFFGRNSDETGIHNYFISNFDNCYNLNQELKQNNIRGIKYVGIKTDTKNPKIQVSISTTSINKKERYSGILNVVIIVTTFILMFFYDQHLTSLNLLLGLSSTTVIMPNIILSFEKDMEMVFETHKVKKCITELEKEINTILTKHMTDCISHCSIQEFDNKLYFVLLYNHPKRGLRFLFSIYTIGILGLVMYLMYVNGINYIVAIFPAILGYANFTFGKESKLLDQNIETKCVEIRPIQNNYILKEDFSKIEVFELGHQQFNILYKSIGKLNAMKKYMKL